MKKLFALFLVTLTLFTLCLSITSCNKVEDIQGSKVTQVNLKFNFYEIKVLEKNDFSKQSIIVKADSSISSVKDLEGKTVAVQKASRAMKFCTEAGYKTIEFATPNDVKLALINGDADAVVTDGNNAKMLYGDKDNNNVSLFKELEERLTKPEKDELLRTVMDEDGKLLRSVIKAEKDGDTVVIFHCLTDKNTEKIAEKYKYLAESYGEDYFCKVNEKVVFIGTKEGLKNASKQLWHNRLYHTFIEGQNYNYILIGLKNTLIITLCSLVIGVVLGTIIAIGKYFSEGNPSLAIINFMCDLYTTVIRGVPITVLLLIFFFVIMVSADGVLVAIIAFGINSGAYMAELIRSGINAVDKGQMEAARSLGMSKAQAMSKIIFPQAIKNILPAIGNECIALLKETSVAGYVAVVDLTRGANLIRNNTYDAFNPLILSALVYLVLVVGMTKLLSIFERRLRRSDGK
ncbi:MAG: ABC transporter permease subunit [Ruminococcaceae bacterium]|nr:ABC transporter permease subunit [Oscillospiraceae bacterium]